MMTAARLWLGRCAYEIGLRFYDRGFTEVAFPLARFAYRMGDRR